MHLVALLPQVNFASIPSTGSPAANGLEGSVLNLRCCHKLLWLQESQVLLADSRGHAAFLAKEWF